MKKILLKISTAFMAVGLVAAFSGPAAAKVTGVCSNCHTMHNSQGGTPMSGVGNISETGPFDALTRGTCVGCHSNTGNETIKDSGTSKIPVVFNTVQPEDELAGGNFYWVVENGAEYGHNVLTIPGILQDGNLDEAPGIPGSASNGAECDDCHSRIADCTGCHNPYHHGEDDRPVVGVRDQDLKNDEKAVFYRFLANGSDKHAKGGGDWDRGRQLGTDQK